MNPKIKNLLINTLSSHPIARMGQWLFGQGIPIFMLHRMHTGNKSAHADHLRHCLKYLVDNAYTFLSLYDLIIALRNNQSLPRKSVVFTMDDGFEDQARIAAPIFLEFNCPVTIFLITGMIDNKLWPWDDKVSYIINTTKCESLNISISDDQYQLPLHSQTEKFKARETIRNAIKAISSADLEKVLAQLEILTQVNIPESPPADFKPMTWGLAREYEKKGVHFAPHTISHRILSKLDTATMETEILGSWKRIQDELASPKPLFCYPTGRFCDFGSREVKLLRNSGFVGAVTTIPAQVRPECSNNYYVYSLPRYSLPDSFHDFIMYCTWIEHAKERKLRFWPN